MQPKSIQLGIIVFTATVLVSSLIASADKPKHSKAKPIPDPEVVTLLERDMTPSEVADIPSIDVSDIRQMTLVGNAGTGNATINIFIFFMAEPGIVTDSNPKVIGIFCQLFGQANSSTSQVSHIANTDCGNIPVLAPHAVFRIINATNDSGGAPTTSPAAVIQVILKP